MTNNLQQAQSHVDQSVSRGMTQRARGRCLGRQMTAGLLQIVLTVGAAVGGFAIADGNPTAPSVAVAAEKTRVRWTPRKERGNAKGTLSGGRRGQESSACGPEGSTKLTLLVPDGRESLVTTQAQPTLSWQVVTHKPTSMQLILSDMAKPMPLYTQTLQAQATGVASVTLPEAVALEDDTRYRWTVIVDCPDGQKEEIYARSFIRKTSRASLEQQLNQKSAVSQAAVFAENGIWYDALGQLLNAEVSEKQTSQDALTLLLDQGVPGLELREGVLE